MIDISDGLASDVLHLCEESKVGALIWEERIPIAPCAKVAGRELGKDPLPLAIRGGEDYELLFATSLPAEVESAFQAANLARVTRIGKVSSDQKNQVSLLRRDGTLAPMDGGFDHFRSQSG